MRKVQKIFLIFILSFIILFSNTIPAFALGIMVHVPEKYTDVQAGERFYFEIEIKYPENPIRKDLRLEYEIKDSNGKVIAQAKHLKAIETQASFMDYVVIPERTEKGLYNIDISISDYEDLKADVSASFNVTSQGSDQTKIYFFALLSSIGFVGLLVIINIVVLKRKK